MGLLASATTAIILHMHPAPPAGYVYIIRDETQHLIKIGVAKNPQKRLAQLQTGSPNKLEIVKTIPSNQPFKLEKEMHNENASKHYRGEWYHE